MALDRLAIVHRRMHEQRLGKQHTYMLLDERVPEAEELTRDRPWPRSRCATSKVTARRR